EQTIREKKFGAAAGITGGMILLGLSAWRLIEDDQRDQYSRGLGVMFMTLGMADLTIGVFAATRIPHEKHRLDRWERARKDGITDIELAHFEGELQASHETREGERLLVRWGGLTHALAGLLVLAFAPIPDSMNGSDRVAGYVISRYPKRERVEGIQQAEDSHAGARVPLGRCSLDFQARGRHFGRRRILVATGLHCGRLTE
ncbi:MAG: hypothetical protein JRH14_22945, partial [Deltaproteobacteria bacterium]|nr:hypothetical protein [Deltaproteobacteria bacterium]